ncbi:MAG: BadF/BadG/BcrA/BcrD ATPase family protein [Lysobacterales bacterium]
MNATSARACFLGIDGGGTKTRFALIDGDGHLLAQAQLGTTYHPEVGLDGAADVLARGVAQVLQDAGIGGGDIGHAFFGLPAYGEDSALLPRLRALPGPILGHARYTCDNDMVCGWAGSLGCADGINIVAGTGSIGYGQRNGIGARAGGWGEVFSDEGSAYWIAVQGLNAYSRMSDGRAPKGPLHAGSMRPSACARTSTSAPTSTANALTRGELARLSPLVATAALARKRRPRARSWTGPAAKLAQIADAIRTALHFEPGERVPVSTSGGAFSAGELLLASFRDALRHLRDIRIGAPAAEHCSARPVRREARRASISAPFRR